MIQKTTFTNKKLKTNNLNQKKPQKKAQKECTDDTD
jgi:hypothetical protein